MTKITKFNDFTQKNFNEGIFDIFKRKKRKEQSRIFTEEEYQVIKKYIYNNKSIDVETNFSKGTIICPIKSLYKNSKSAEGDITTVEVFVNNGGARRNDFSQDKATGYYTITKSENEYYVNSYKDSYDELKYIFKSNNIEDVCDQVNKSIVIYKMSTILEVKYEKMESLSKDYSLFTNDYKVNKFRLKEVIEELDENPAHFPLDQDPEFLSTISELTLSIDEILESVITRVQKIGIKINDI